MNLTLSILKKWLLICLVFYTYEAIGQIKVQQKIPEKTRILFLLDGSGSMVERWGGPNQNKMSVAKTILSKIVDSLKQNNQVELALRVYGHSSVRETNNCKDSKLEVPFKPNNHKLIMAKISEIKPKGVTPITYSLEQAAYDFPAGPGYRNIVILITDGIESCAGDPCAASQALQKQGVFLRPYIIGLGLQSARALDCMGKFVDAETPGQFNKILNEAIETTFAKTTVSVELLDSQQHPTESNINVTFVNNVTGSTVYEFVHYRDKEGKPDSVLVDPLMDYDLTVNTVPPVVKRNVAINIGKHNIIDIPVPQGNLLIQQEGRKNSNVKAIVRERDKHGILNVQQLNQPFRYLTGVYEVETLTLPRRIHIVEIRENQTHTIKLPSHAVVNFNTISSGYGVLYEIKEDGKQEWICNLNDQKPAFTFNLLPGRYKIVFRVKNSGGSKYTGFKTFSVKSGETLTVNVFS